ncbi:hypothetical protein MAR_021213 [Mya arenaria]|uniref:Uncharacterized protein n=1 Tax=Mya arenaria TaxID=6604 RepID=A0ABY7E9N2_MYAAR|nr:hypothetical protein MAR_021213 [Mya arenaria]
MEDFTSFKMMNIPICVVMMAVHDFDNDFYFAEEKENELSSSTACVFLADLEVTWYTVDYKKNKEQEEEEEEKKIEEEKKKEEPEKKEKEEEEENKKRMTREEEKKREEKKKEEEQNHTGTVDQ